MGAVRVMQMPSNQEIDVVPVGNCIMSAALAMNVLRLVSTTSVIRRADSRVTSIHSD